MGPFKLDVDRLTEHRERFEFEAPEKWWVERESDGEGERCDVEQPFRFDLEAARIRDQIVLEGEMTGQVGFECGRCAKRYSHALRDSFRLVLSLAKDREPVDPDDERSLVESGITLGEDLEAGWFKGPVVGLDNYFGELVALAMPLQPVCRSDCPGICSHCGQDLSQAQCDCVDEKIDSPFAVLAKLKGGNNE
jgi:uncharacterized protein